jgi:hypothetical protein
MNQSCTNHEYFMKLHEQFIKVLEIINSTSQGITHAAINNQISKQTTLDWGRGA